LAILIKKLLSTYYAETFQTINLTQSLLLAYLLSLFTFSGIKVWLKRATSLEIIFVFSHITFLIVHTIIAYSNTHSIFSMPRYWLPLIPFFSFFIVVGAYRILQNLLHVFTNIKIFQKTKLIIISFVLAPLIIIHISHLLHFQKKEWDIFKKERQSASKQIKQFVQKNIPASTAIMTIDIGYTPFLTDRFSTTLVASEKTTFNRILNKKAEYLITFFTTQVEIAPYNAYSLTTDHPTYSFTKCLLTQYPLIFNKVLDIPSQSPRNEFAIYQINRQLIRTALHSPSKENKHC
jgi:hypothetical protein